MNNVKRYCKFQLIPILLITAFILSILMPSSFAFDSHAKVNAIHVFINDVEMAASGESIEVDLDGDKNTIPASLLYGDVLYLPLSLLAEGGMEFDFPDEGQEEENLTIIVSYMDCSQAEPIYPRIENSKDLSFDMLTNLFNIIVGETQFAKAGENIEFQGNSIPSLIWKENMMYFPIEPILKELDIDSHWENDSSTFIIGEGAPIEKMVGIENFKKKNRYISGQFADVPSSTWYTSQVKTAFEYGLMVGTNSSSFNPNGNISIAEAITIASRLHSTYYATDYEFKSGTPWYQSYVDYAAKNKITQGTYINYDSPISRSEFAMIIANTFPLPAINEVEDGAIPDVFTENDYYDAVYLLYRAGIISGRDTIGTFAPDANISRAEVAVILSSMVDESLRKHFSIKAPILPASISMPSSVAVPIGGSRTLTAKISPINVNRDSNIVWSSSNPIIASIDNNGTINGIKTGDVEIIAATANGISATCKVTVKSLTDFDIQFAKYALDKLKSQLKFPDTLQVFGIHANSYWDEYSNSQKMGIFISYSASTPLGQQQRGTYMAIYYMDANKFQTDQFYDSDLISKSKSDSSRTVDINKVLTP